jgi:stress-induced morphogen
VSAAFAGLSRVRQHQLVYAALKGRMGGELHALALETSAPPSGETGPCATVPLAPPDRPSPA